MHVCYICNSWNVKDKLKLEYIVTLIAVLRGKWIKNK